MYAWQINPLPAAGPLHCVARGGPGTPPGCGELHATRRVADIDVAGRCRARKQQGDPEGGKWRVEAYATRKVGDSAAVAVVA